eukprot:TRINITY_DN9208_c0_g1_i1.p1 TRINITY_DN9208_c0_g1~~TRINITY_DN9208_c0_g1_i1.p1  ORF type:complete len:167 (+),score=22.21 TRINITY_DN9208_c0_g1_i1:162-662(+)
MMLPHTYLFRQNLYNDKALQRSQQVDHVKVHFITFIMQAYTRRTRDILARFFENLIECEYELERLRQELAASGLSLIDMFNDIDHDRDSLLSEEDIRLYMNRYGIFTGVSDLKLFVQKIDKNNNGSISLDEFMQWLTPILPQLKLHEKASSNYSLYGLYTLSLIHI